MKREWQPGDVALASYDGEVKTYLYGREFETDRFRWIGADGSTSVDFRLAEWWGPLVVIDPEDRQQVEQLVKALSTGQPTIGLDPTNREMVDQAWVTRTQTALREFDNSTPPKPEEPTGLGAVVEDAAGRKWVRTEWRYPWTVTYDEESGESNNYADIDVVRILSEGVTA